MLHLALKSPSIFVVALSAAGLLAACSSDADHTFGNGTAGAAGAAKGGSSNGGSSAAGSGNTGNGGSGGSALGGSSSTAAGGSGGSSIPAGGSGGSGGTGSGTAGASVGGSAGAGVAGGSMTGGVACPANATFCSDFETTALPTGAVYKVNAAPGEWTRDFEIDTTVFHGGKSSLRVKSGSGDTNTSGSAYRMLAVPAPSGAFWVRFYIQQTELDLGGTDHNVFAAAAASDDPNAAGAIEFAEDVGIAFNTSDAVRWPMGYGRLTGGGTMPYTLPKGMWHCIEISYDGQGREQQLFINGTQQIDAKDYPSTATAIKNFKFGFNQLHGPARKVWYDDVAVAPTRIKCL